jgi:hypothetical protein
MHKFLRPPPRYIWYARTLSLHYRLLLRATKLSGIEKIVDLVISFVQFIPTSPSSCEVERYRNTALVKFFDHPSFLCFI